MGGFTANVTIQNNGPTINGWTLKWNFAGNQQITNLWNGTISQNGAQVTVSNTSYNASIPAGGTVSFGFQASFSGTNVNPTRFTLNNITGSACGLSSSGLRQLPPPHLLPPLHP